MSYFAVLVFVAGALTLRSGLTLVLPARGAHRLPTPRQRGYGCALTLAAFGLLALGFALA